MIIRDETLTLSDEHIIPFALGGSNGFTTKDASKKYNSDLGRDIDAKFINLLPLSIKRHILQLQGQSGSIPPIEWLARSTDNGEPARIKIHSNGHVEYIFDTVVIDDKKTSHEERLVAGSPDRVKDILNGMLSKADRKGQTLYSETGTKIEQSVDFEKFFEIEETELFHASVQAFDFDVWVRGMFKIILGLGHIILGPNWTFSSDGGDRIRSVLFSKREDWPERSLKGFSVGTLPESIHSILGITPTVRAANLHTVAILPQEQETLAVISLFGGDFIPEAMVSLGSEKGKLAVVNDMMDPATRIGARIDPRTRKTNWITVGDINNAVPEDA